MLSKDKLRTKPRHGSIRRSRAQPLGLVPGRLYDHFLSMWQTALGSYPRGVPDSVYRHFLGNDLLNAPTDIQSDFASLGLAAPLLQALQEIGYYTPTPIQARTIPSVLAGTDVLGQAQTGTGKTAAFALPLLTRLIIQRRQTQTLVLTPTRELAIQVADAFQSYSRYLPGCTVLALYGGQSYTGQIRALRQGAQIVVGTPGRVMDHMRRGTLALDNLTTLVLDEADEMLRMGFIEDVEWILNQAPAQRQMALFSATMPEAIRRIAERYLRAPTEVRIGSATTTAVTIRQRYLPVTGMSRLDALLRLLEAEPFDAVLAFVRTKAATVELAEQLTACGYNCEPLNGDIAQKLRERTVERLRNGQLDIVVATDVAARGLDVDRISHVLNYDIPGDAASYVHRIGRTGRAGRTGEAVLLVTPREHRVLRMIEKATRQPIESMPMPSTAIVNARRVARFKERIGDVLATRDLEPFLRVITDYARDNAVEPLQIAAALARLAHGEKPFLSTQPDPGVGPLLRRQRHPYTDHNAGRKRDRDNRAQPLKGFPDVRMERFRVNVGYQHKLRPSNLVGAIANETDLESRYIGHIEIYDEYATVDLPQGMPRELLAHLNGVRVCGRRLGLRPLAGFARPDVRGSRRKPVAHQACQG